MAWVKLDDKVMTHPRIFSLSDKSFRLWIWGLCYAQQHLTDGLIPAGLIPARLRRSAPDLVTRELWRESGGNGPVPVPGYGYAIRDFLQWNDSKADVERKRRESADRQAVFRSSRNALVTPASNGEVPVWCGESDALTEKESEENRATDLGARAATLLQELYPAWYAKYRHGAKLRLVSNSLAYQDALSVVGTWDDARIEQLARIVLTTDEKWIAETDRNFRIFASKASWADNRLRELEAQAS